MSLVHTGRPWRGSTWPQGTTRTSGTPRTRTQICKFTLALVTCCVMLEHNLYQSRTACLCWIQLIPVHVFQTFVDMEGSGFPDLESVRVRRTSIWNTTVISKKTIMQYVVEGIIFVRLLVKDISVSGHIYLIGCYNSLICKDSIDYRKSAICKWILYVVVVGTAWPPRSPWSPRSSWTLHNRSRLSIQFWGIWTTRKGRCAWSTCRCQCVCLYLAKSINPLNRDCRV